jgi:Uma2 family endonuclease
MQVAATMTSYEEERGKPVPSKNHAIVQSYLILALMQHRDKFTILSELSLELNGEPFVPDISVFSKLSIDWHNDEVKLTDPPSLAIEILSPTQAVDDLVKKADTYFAAGVESCWIVQPSLETIVVLTPNAKPEFHSTGLVVDPATKIEVSVTDIFP